MDEKQFIIADEDGNPEGIKDPLEMVSEDPKPKPIRSARSRPPATPKQDPIPKKTGRPSRSDIEKEVALEMQALIKFGAVMWSKADPNCAVVLSEQSKDISDSLAAILSKHPRLLARMRDMTGFGDYFALTMAILPVAQAISQHHVKPGLEKREGNNNGGS